MKPRISEELIKPLNKVENIVLKWVKHLVRVFNKGSPKSRDKVAALYKPRRKISE